MRARRGSGEAVRSPRARSRSPRSASCRRCAARVRAVSRLAAGRRRPGRRRLDAADSCARWSLIARVPRRQPATVAAVAAMRPRRTAPASWTRRSGRSRAPRRPARSATARAGRRRTAPCARARRRRHARRPARFATTSVCAAMYACPRICAATFRFDGSSTPAIGSTAIGPPPLVRFMICRPMFSKRVNTLPRLVLGLRLLRLDCERLRAHGRRRRPSGCRLRGPGLHVAADAARVLVVEDALGRHRAEPQTRRARARSGSG